MREFSELNINESGKRVERGAPSDDTIAEFQNSFDIVLPEEYLALLRYANGGHPELDSIESITAGAARWAVNRFYHLDDDKSSNTSLWMAMKKWRSILGDRALPFAQDSGGNQFFLNLNTSPPNVKVCVHDANFSTIEVASSFENFINGLSIDPDMI